MSTASMQFKSLSLSEPADKVLQVDINRPKKLNSMNADFWIEWEQLFEAIADDGDIRIGTRQSSLEAVFDNGNYNSCSRRKCKFYCFQYLTMICNIKFIFLFVRVWNRTNLLKEKCTSVNSKYTIWPAQK